MDALRYSKIAKILVYGKPDASFAGKKVGGKGGGERDFRWEWEEEEGDYKERKDELVPVSAWWGLQANLHSYTREFTRGFARPYLYLKYNL